MLLKFHKMHGAGNDFVVLDGIRQQVKLNPQQLRLLADRHFGIGCDQILLVEAADHPQADFKYRIFNADGSEVEQCGNGARCFARFVFEQGLTDKKAITVETLGGLIMPRLEDDGRVTVDMGSPVFDPASIPFQGEGSPVETLTVDDQAYQISALSMGNPHAVLFVESTEDAPVNSLGATIENHPRFPKRVNVGFAQVANRHQIKLRVFERGAGETLACGSGACAAAVAGIRRGLIDSPVNIITRGGTLTIQWAGDNHNVLMTGPACTVFSGEITLQD